MLSDGDFYGDNCDNCPVIKNPNQEDHDKDGYEHIKQKFKDLNKKKTKRLKILCRNQFAILICFYNCLCANFS